VFDSNGPLAQKLYPFVGWERYLPLPRRCSSTELLERAGLLSPNTLAVHCVHISQNDAEILQQRGVHVTLCPRSNDLLDVGRAPIALFKRLNIPLAIGTDSLASNNTLSLWDEMRFAGDTFAKELSPTDLFQMANLGGAAALGIESTQGSLEPGKQANFQIIRLPEKPLTPETLPENILYEGSLNGVFVKGARVDGGKADEFENDEGKPDELKRDER
jgi:cytosine/adenosine deaminase-related metal-dependent hydrolase